ncbi:MAG: monovalent cation/H+ antiporter complex subunit F [Azospirillaceae bacterium]
MSGSWSDMVLAVCVSIAAFVVAASIVCVLLRVLIGPSRADRVVALDLLAICIVGLVACLAMIDDVPALLDVALAVSVLGFLATVGFARYLERADEPSAARTLDSTATDREA